MCWWCACTRRFWRTEAAQEGPRQGHLGAPLQGNQQLREIPRRNGTVVLKFFLNISKEEQKKRFLARIDEADKNWKFSVADYKERGFWNDYQDAFEDMLENTSTEWAPWFVIPADNKWFARLAISQIITATLEGLDLSIPSVDYARLKELAVIREQLMAE